MPARPSLPRINVAERPRFLTTGLLRLAGLCGVIVVIGMLPGHLTPTKAGVIALVGLIALPIAIAIPFLASVRSFAGRAPAVAAGLRYVNHFGLVGLGAAFFLFWTFVYMGLWWRHPHEAFTGLGPHPRFADFFYTSVSTAFISPPGDILAHSRGARSATMIEMLTGFAVVAVYLSSFVDWAAPRQEEPEQE